MGKQLKKRDAPTLTDASGKSKSKVINKTNNGVVEESASTVGNSSPSAGKHAGTAGKSSAKRPSASSSTPGKNTPKHKKSRRSSAGKAGGSKDPGGGSPGGDGSPGGPPGGSSGGGRAGPSRSGGSQEGRVVDRYCFWTSKGGVGKTTLCVHTASLLAAAHPDDIVLVVDMDGQANASEMLLTKLAMRRQSQPGETRIGGKSIVHMLETESENIETKRQGFGNAHWSPTVLGYLHACCEKAEQSIDAEVFTTQVNRHNPSMPPNLYLLCGDTRLDYLAPELEKKMMEDEAVTYFYLRDLGQSIHQFAQKLAAEVGRRVHLIVDTNPAMTPYTQIALLSTEKLIMPVSADDFSHAAVSRIFPLLYGMNMRYSRPLRPLKKKMFAFRIAEAELPIAKIHLVIHNCTHMRSKTDQVNSCKGAAQSIGNLLFEEFQKICRVDPKNVDRVFSLRGRFRATRNELMAMANAPGDDGKARFQEVFATYIRNFRSAGVASSRSGLPMWRIKRHISAVHDVTQISNIHGATSIVADFIGFPLDWPLPSHLENANGDTAAADYREAVENGTLQKMMGGGLADDFRKYILTATTCTVGNLQQQYSDANGRNPPPRGLLWDYVYNS